MGYTFAIGDIHGCIHQLNEMLNRIEAYASSGKVVFLGDYVDRGPNSRAVLERLIAGPPEGWSWTCLKGNHEDMMVKAYQVRRERDFWIGNGGLETEISYSSGIPSEHIEWAQTLPLIHMDQHRIFVHAGVVPEFPLNMQSDHDLLWVRMPPDYPGDFWGRHLVHGHTPSNSHPLTFANRTNVDSGCVFWGKLAAAVFDDDTSGGPIEFIEVTRKTATP